MICKIYFDIRIEVTIDKSLPAALFIEFYTSITLAIQIQQYETECSNP